MGKHRVHAKYFTRRNLLYDQASVINSRALVVHLLRLTR